MIGRATFALCLLLLCFAPTQAANGTGKSVIDGRIDLSSWDFASNEAIELAGDWHFYWQQFITPGQPPLKPSHIQPFPSMWNGIRLENGIQADGNGYASYRLVLTLQNETDLALDIPTMHSAYRLFWNGKQITQNGKPGKTQATTKALYSPHVVPMKAQAGKNELVIHISNFDHNRGGTWAPIKLGAREILLSDQRYRSLREIFLICSLVVLGLYHLVFFLFRPQAKSLLFFGLFCTVVGLRFLFAGEHHGAKLIPNFSFPLYLSFQYLGFFIAVPLWATFAYHIFPRQHLRWLLFLVYGLTTPFVLSVIILPSELFTVTMPYFEMITLALGLLMFWLLSLAVKNGENGARLFWAGWFLMFLTIVNDILFIRGVITSAVSVPFGLFLFVFLQASVLARRFSAALSQSEEFSKILEVKVKQRTQQLEESTSELAVAREKAEHANNAKSEFLATMSHEMRTPLNSVLGAIELLNESVVSNEQRRNMETLTRSSEVLLQLLNDVLDFSKIESGNIVLENRIFHPEQVIKNLIHVFQLQAENKGLELTFNVDEEIPPTLIGDSGRLGQVLMNLISNAVKFTASGTVSITAQKIKSGSEKIKLKFSVIDTGIGIPQEKQKLIFDSFTQADSSVTREYGGTGLGLAISQKIVTAMEGKIDLESEIAKGSKFSFTAVFERVTKEESQTKQGYEPAVIERDLNLLLVDDNKDNQNLIKAFLQTQPIAIDTALNGAEAFDRFKDKDYDIVLMDIQMPVMDGYTATRTIRKWENESGKTEVPVLILTANATKENIELGSSVGYQARLTKPITKQALINAIAFYSKLKTPTETN